MLQEEKAQLEAEAQKRAERAPVNSQSREPAEEKLLEWPELELERVNSFLSSRLQEIKNTIKDSIRASFSVYDLNLDVNDFPKKAAVLEQKNLISHLNGSSDLQDIDLALAPLSLGPTKSHTLLRGELGPRWGDGPGELPLAPTATENGVVKRLSAVPSLSRMIWVQSKAADSAVDCGGQSPEPKEGLQPKEPEPSEQVLAGGRQRKNKRQSGQVKKGDGAVVLSGQARLENSGVKGQVLGTKHPSKPSTAEPQRVGGCTEVESGKGQPWGCGTARPEKERSSDWKGRRGEGKAELPDLVQMPTPATGDRQLPPLAALGGSPQPKGKSRKNRNKVEKSNTSIGECLQLCPAVLLLLWPLPQPLPCLLPGPFLSCPGVCGSHPWHCPAGNSWVLGVLLFCGDLVLCLPDDVFLPKDLDSVEMDETDREVEYFKR